MLLTVSTTANAQNAEEKATIDAVAKIISSKPENVEKEIKPFFKKNKKNPLVLTGFASAFYDAKDYNSAIAYADKAIAIDPNYTPAYILKGDIYVMLDNGGEAAKWYEQAIYFNPKDPVGYYKYANIYRGKNPALAVSKLADLRTQRPDLAVDALAGRIYYTSNDLKNAIKYYDKVSDLGQMEKEDIKNYSTACYLMGKLQKSAEVANFGLKSDARDAGLNRLVFYNNTDLKNYSTAITYAEKLFNESDSAKFTYLDYIYYGHAFMGQKNYDSAIEKFQLALQQEVNDKDQKAGIYQQLSNAYNMKNDVEKAVEFYNKFMETKSKVYPSDYAGLAQIYTVEAQASTDAAKQTEYYNKAFELYNHLTSAENEENIRVYGLLQQGRIKASLDPETTEGLAKPYYDSVIKILEAKAQLEDSDKAKLIESYRYCGYYFFSKADYETSKALFEKVLTLDPQKAQVLQALEGINEMLKKK